jgi:hypothetical protein
VPAAQGPLTLRTAKGRIDLRFDAEVDVALPAATPAQVAAWRRVTLPAPAEAEAGG